MDFKDDIQDILVFGLPSTPAFHILGRKVLLFVHKKALLFPFPGILFKIVLQVFISNFSYIFHSRDFFSDDVKKNGSLILQILMAW